MGFNKVLIDKNFTGGRAGDNVREIIIHTYGGPGRSLYNWFNNEQAQVSAHYASFLDGTGEQYVEEWNTAWQAGIWDVNIRSIGIEHQDNGNPNDSFRTPEQYHNTAEICASICIRYGFPATSSTISPHNKYVEKICPGGLDINRIIMETNQILSPVIDDNLYKISIGNNQIGAFTDKDNAFNQWYTTANAIVKFNNKDITIDFINIMNYLQQRLNDSQAQLLKSQSDNSNLASQNIALVDQNKELTQKIQNMESKLVDKNSLTISQLIGLLILKILQGFNKLKP